MRTCGYCEVEEYELLTRHKQLLKPGIVSTFKLCKPIVGHPFTLNLCSTDARYTRKADDLLFHDIA